MPYKFRYTKDQVTPAFSIIVECESIKHYEQP